MNVLRRFVTVAVMVYLLLTLLFLATDGARMAMMSLFGGTPTLFWFTMTLIGAGLLLLQLLTENAYNVAVGRHVSRHEAKINELKAKLYDHQLDQRDRDLRPGATTAPRPEPAPNSIARSSMPRAAAPLEADHDLPRTAVPPPSAADLPPSALPPTTQHPGPGYAGDRPAL